MNDEHRYDDMLDLPRHSSTLHKHMSIEDRAAQFIPFQAVQGYEDAVKETARLTDEKIELSENQKQELNEKINFLIKHKNILISITYYVLDGKKAGGHYKTIIDNLKNIDLINKTIILHNKQIIKMEDILDITIQQQMSQLNHLD